MQYSWFSNLLITYKDIEHAAINYESKNDKNVYHRGKYGSISYFIKYFTVLLSHIVCVFIVFASDCTRILIQSTNTRGTLYLQCLNRSTFPFKYWVKSERTLSERIVHATWNLVSADERWTVSERRAQMESKLERKVHYERTVNDIWTLCEHKINDLFGVSRMLSLHSISSVIKK